MVGCLPRYAEVDTMKAEAGRNLSVMNAFFGVWSQYSLCLQEWLRRSQETQCPVKRASRWTAGIWWEIPWCLRQVPLTRYMLLSGLLFAVKDFCFDRWHLSEWSWRSNNILTRFLSQRKLVNLCQFYLTKSHGISLIWISWDENDIETDGSSPFHVVSSPCMRAGLTHAARKVIMGLLRNGNPQKVGALGLRMSWCYESYCMREQNSRKLGMKGLVLWQWSDEMMKCLQFLNILQYFLLQLQSNSLNPHPFGVHYRFDTFYYAPQRLKTCCRWWRRMSFPSMMWCFKRHTIASYELYFTCNKQIFGWNPKKMYQNVPFGCCIKSLQMGNSSPYHSHCLLPTGHCASRRGRGSTSHTPGNPKRKVFGAWWTMKIHHKFEGRCIQGQ